MDTPATAATLLITYPAGQDTVPVVVPRKAVLPWQPTPGAVAGLAASARVSAVGAAPLKGAAGGGPTCAKVMFATAHVAVKA